MVSQIKHRKRNSQLSYYHAANAVLFIGMIGLSIDLVIGCAVGTTTAIEDIPMSSAPNAIVAGFVATIALAVLVSRMRVSVLANDEYMVVRNPFRTLSIRIDDRTAVYNYIGRENANIQYVVVSVRGRRRLVKLWALDPYGDEMFIRMMLER